MVVSDASATLALIRQEPGSEKCAGPDQTVIGAVNHSEVIARLLDLGFQAEGLHARVALLYSQIVPFDERQSEIAGGLRLETRHLGISLGDRACLALAKTLDLPIQTADRRMAALDIGAEIRLIR